MKRFWGIRFLFLSTLLWWAACQDAASEKVVVAVAANMQLPMEAIARAYTEKHGQECELIIGSSGKLTAQILEGAPYDIFIAANMKYPEAVYAGDKAQEAPRAYAHGRLVLWSMGLEGPLTVDRLLQPDITHIALANPKTAPYGEAAVAVLNHFGRYQEVEKKLVYGESIAQTNQFITSGAAQIGFTAMSTVLSPQMRGKGNWVELDPKHYAPIVQGVVRIRRDNGRQAEVQQFYDFLFSGEAKEILKNFGYLMDE